MARSSYLDRDIIKRCAQITIEEEEEGGVVLEEGVTREETVDFFRWSLVGRFLSDRSVNFVAMKNTLAALWRPVKGVIIRDIGPNTFIFQFFYELDMDRVVQNRPWTFDNNILLVKKISLGDQPLQMELYTCEMWVQVFDVPVGFMFEKVATQIGDYIGCFIASDPNNFSGLWRSYIRIRVGVDVRIPIKRRMKMKKAGGEWFWLTFKYERLPTFCFYCGMLGHSDKFCSKLYDNPNAPPERAYGVWLRASFRRPVNSIGEQWLRSEIPSSAHGGGDSEAMEMEGVNHGTQEEANRNLMIRGDLHGHLYGVNGGYVNRGVLNVAETSGDMG